jgi:hypothetical protein
MLGFDSLEAGQPFVTSLRVYRSTDMPKRDEEKEVERKARAKRARESRRSTQVSDTFNCNAFNI